MINILRLCLFILLPFNFLYGGEVLWKNRLEGSSSVRPLETGRQLRITDGNYGSIGSFTDVRQHAYVRLGMSERTSSPYLAGDINILVGVSITPYSNTGASLPLVNKTLNVNYSSGAASITYDSDDYRLQGNVYKFKVVVTSITLNGVATNTNLPDFLYLEAGISAERYYNFTGTTQVGDIEANIVSYSQGGSETVTRNITQTTQATDDIEFAWSYVAGAEYYDLEWVWVDNYASSNTFPDLTTSAITMSEADFAHNCTRIRTSMQSYRIPQVYAKGYIIYRIRPVGRWASKPTLDKYGPWNHDLSEKIHVSDWPYVVRVISAHEDRKNWQYQATYAEEGKKKEVVQYFDGSLRGRQTVTRITSDRRSVVGETVYDNEGRPSIQILPAPQANPAIRYYPDFNTNSQSRAYSHSDFDWETGGACIPAPAAIVSGTSGAGKYYSAAAHALDQDWQQYVAESSGYPFSQTEYTPDNTGRIRKQGGIGPVHQVGNGHETDYYYLQANQNELNRLFGYKVGNSVHYKKNLVVDPNGQVSISYLDPQGRVIATSMAGDNPENMAGLPSEEDPTYHQRLSADLLNKMDPDAPDGPLDNNIPFSTGRFGMVKDGLKYTSQLGVEKPGTLYDFKYSARFGSYTETCTEGPGVNFNYVYDLKLSVLDDCGESVFSETVTALDASMFESASQAFERSYLNQVLTKNAYTIHKEIVVNEASLNAYKSQYLDEATNPCILSVSDFKFPAVTGCYDTDCASCEENLGTLAEFKLAYVSSGMTEFEIEAMYEREQAACAELCAPGSFCDVYYSLMINDISPDGQYGATEGTDPLSVYSTSNDLPGNWKSAGVVYLDEFSNPATVDAFHLSDGSYTLSDDGTGLPVSITPKLLTHVEDFIVALQPSWLDALVKFHPEYKLYVYAAEICNEPWSNPESTKAFTSGEYDALLRNINTYAQAQVNVIGVNFASGNKIYQADPYFNKDYSVHYINSDIAYRDLKKALLVEAVDNNFRGMGMSLLQYAVKITVYPNDYTVVTPTQNTWAACAVSFPSQMDAIWMNYKSNYLSFKSQVDQLFMDYYGFSQTFDTPGNTPGKYIYNGYIGNNGQQYKLAGAFIYNCPGQSPSSLSASVTNKLFSLWGSLLSNWPIAFQGAAYDSKTIRFTRFDNLHDASLCGSDILAETTALADHAVWESTGLCPLTIDMEHLLDAMGKRGILTSMTSMAVLPELVPDLFEAIRGSYPATGSTMNVTGSVDVSGNLVLAFSGTPSCGITLPQLSASLPWSTYGISGWKIFGISHSYPVSASSVSVLVKAGATLATAGEYVITYSTSCLGLNDCQADYANNNGASQDCDKEAELEAALLNMLQKLRAAGKLNLTGVSLNVLAGFVYNNVMIQHFGTTATWNGSTATITGSAGTLELGISIPSTSPAVQYVSVNLIGGDFHFSYLNANAGTVNRQSGTYAYRYGDKITPLYLNCVCAPDFTTQVTALLNYALGTIVIGDGNNSQVTGLAPYISISNPGIFDFLHTNLNNQPNNLVRGISFNLNRSGECQVSLFVNMPVNLSISSVSNVRFPYPTSAPETFLCDMLLSNGTTLEAVEGTFGCLEVSVRCESCLPAAQQPLSCNVAYPVYQLAMTAKFGTGLSTEDQLIFTSEYLSSESVFCDHQYAYISTAYIAYINHLTGISDTRYLGISEFGATRLGYSSTLLSPAVAAYFAYLAGNPSSLLTWNQYVGQIYLPAHPEICPAKIPVVAIPETIDHTDPCLLSNSINAVNSQVLYATYLEQMGAAFTQAYVEKAMSSLVETFTEAHVGKEYHYTLYYYDRAGNLIQTVPPEGVKRYQYDASEAPVGVNTPTNVVINAARTASPLLSSEGTLAAPAPEHTYKTHYSYNSLNQLVFQQTPDGDTSRFAYDALGRLIASQQAEQALTGKFSYTMYDFLGRAVEAGEFTSPAGQLTIDDKGRLVNASTSAPVGVNLYNWIENYPYPRAEVTKSLYDGLNGVTSPLASGTVLVADLFGPAYSKGNTRNRITGVIYKATVPASSVANKNVYENATFYDYDVHGNVKHLLQVNCHAGLLSLNQHIKHFEYRYDLVSGNVKEVRYQPGAADQFLHQYHYDADNRITDVLTSGDGIYFEKDAKYFYYAHGPLARVETGDKKVQAQDYAYTITGWLKAVNGEKMASATAMGQDAGAGTINSMVPRDVFGYSLHYYTDDYAAANTRMLNYSASNTNMGTNLYNGNIRTMVTAIGTPQDLNTFAPHKTNYTYDQLNRIKSMTGYNAATDAVSDYKSSYSYDANGNLSNLVRYAGSTTQMDNLSYTYLPGKNQLDHVEDAQLNAALYTEDIDNTQLAENYRYDKTGRLTRDVSEKISEIRWTVTNKVKDIIYSTVPAKSISFDYDALGNRIAKHVKESGGTTSTYYFLDAQGNAMSIYSRKKEGSDYNLYLSERNIYGSQRIGMEEVYGQMTMQTVAPVENLVEQRFDAGESSLVGWDYQSACSAPSTQSNASGQLKVSDDCSAQHDLFINTIPGHHYEFSANFDLTDASNFFIVYYEHPDGCGYRLTYRDLPVNTGLFSFAFDATTTCSRISLRNYGTAGEGGVFLVDNLVVKHWAMPSTANSLQSIRQKVGDKRYELSNHLGNVNVVITDRKVQVRNLPTITDQVGITVSGGTITATASGWGNSGGASEETLLQDGYFEWTLGGTTTENRNIMVGLSYSNADALYTSIDYAFYTYTAGINVYVAGALPAGHVYGQYPGLGIGDVLRIERRNGNILYSRNNILLFTAVDNHPQTPMVVDFAFVAAGRKIHDLKIRNSNDYEAVVVMKSDYFPFGMTMPGRNFNSSEYRYGFNSMEKDDEVKGSGNSYDFGARIYDPRIGRWLTIDPLAEKYPSISPYTFVSNNPLIFIDPDGEKIKFADNLTPQELIDYKAQIKSLRHNSKTFRKMYRDLRRSKDIYTYQKTNTSNEDEDDDEDNFSPATNTIYIGLEGNAAEIAIPHSIAHETGHAWRRLKNLDILRSDSPYNEGTIEDQVFEKKIEFSIEFEGTHIENVVRSELGDELRPDYGIKSDYTADDVYITRGGNVQLDIIKRMPVYIGKDSKYDYKDKNINHYRQLLKRGHTASEINVNKHEDSSQYH